MEKINGVLEIDNERGVIYFTPTDLEHPLAGATKLRVGRLPTPIPGSETPLDITHMRGADWGNQ